MKIVHHEGRPKIHFIQLEASPLRIWIDDRVELVIRKGDSLKKVARAIAEHSNFKTGKKESLEIAAYWFALGERIYRRKTGGEWTKKELSTKPSREYLSRS